MKKGTKVYFALKTLIIVWNIDKGSSKIPLPFFHKKGPISVCFISMKCCPNVVD